MIPRAKVERELERVRANINVTDGLLAERCQSFGDYMLQLADQLEHGTATPSGLGEVQGAGSYIDTLCARRAAYKEFEKVLVGLLKEAATDA